MPAHATRPILRGDKQRARGGPWCPEKAALDHYSGGGARTQASPAISASELMKNRSSGK